MSYSLPGHRIPHRVLHLNITLADDPILPQPHGVVRPEGAGGCPEGARPEGPSLTFGHETRDSLTSAVSSVATLSTNDRAQVLDLPRGIPHLQPPVLCAARNWAPTSMVTVPSHAVVQSSLIDSSLVPGPRETVRHSWCEQLREDHLVFASLLQHTSLRDTITENEWIMRFGKVSWDHPFGCRIWSGMYDELGSHYLPSKSRWATREHFAPAWFEIPRVFSRVNAKLAKNAIHNPGSGLYYPCMAHRSGQFDVTMICIHILVKRSAAWRVDASWLIW